MVLRSFVSAPDRDGCRCSGGGCRRVEDAFGGGAWCGVHGCCPDAVDEAHSWKCYARASTHMSITLSYARVRACVLASHSATRAAAGAFVCVCLCVSEMFNLFSVGAKSDGNVE